MGADHLEFGGVRLWYSFHNKGKAKASTSFAEDCQDPAMPGYDFRSPRLSQLRRRSGPAPWSRSIPGQAHYLTTVLRLKSGSGVLVYVNGCDGEWNAAIDVQRRTISLRVGANIRAQTAPADLHYVFAPLKAVRLRLYMMQMRSR